MTGVEVLATEEVITGSSFNWLGFTLTFVTVVLIIALVAINKCKTAKECLQCIALVGGITGAIAGFLMGEAAAIPVEHETYYKVTISDEVPLNEFLERYEIVDQEGRIYTIRELEGKDGG